VKRGERMVGVQPSEDLKEMCQRLEEQEVEAQVGDHIGSKSGSSIRFPSCFEDFTVHLVACW